MILYISSFYCKLQESNGLNLELYLIKSNTIRVALTSIGPVWEVDIVPEETSYICDLENLIYEYFELVKALCSFLMCFYQKFSVCFTKKVNGSVRVIFQPQTIRGLFPILY